MAIVISFILWINHTIDISNPDQTSVSSLAGLECPHTTARPVAVMLSSDAVARPLSGISQADMVIEMPVTPDGITRLMAVFQCQRPKEIGSVRSAREDFLPLVAGLKAIYAHWGGEATALERLNQHILDNINGLTYEGTVFYRKRGVKPPHNGFTSFKNLWDIADKLKYATHDQFVGYPHKTKLLGRTLANLVDTIAVPYNGEFAVIWHYDRATNSYLRKRDTQLELDRDNNQNVRASVVILMETTSQPIDIQYINIQTAGSGNARIFQDGVVVEGTWRKDSTSLDTKLLFIDKKGKEIPFTPGPIWIEIVTGSTQ